MPAKLFIQSLWLAEADKEKLDKEPKSAKKAHWDVELSEVQKQNWLEIVANMQSWDRFSVSRYIGHQIKANCELHAFCDASGLASATAIYFRSENGSCHLIFAKSRVKPTSIKVSESLTIPILELIAALIGARALAFVLKELHGTSPKCYLWSDSQCVINWIKSPVRLERRIVENRVNEIRAFKNLNIGFVSTLDNPADIGSRGASAQELAQHNLWWKGPKWLSLSRENWPVCELNFNTNDYVRAEDKGDSVLHEMSLATVKLESIFARANYSKWIGSSEHSVGLRATTVAAYIFRFISRIFNRTGKKFAGKKLKDLSKYYAPPTGAFESLWLKPNERKFAENFLIFDMQECYPPPESHWVDYDLFRDDDGIIEVERVFNTQESRTTRKIRFICQKMHGQLGS